MRIRKAYAFDDVLLVPKLTSISTGDTSLKCRFSRNISLNNPLVSANMDDVTELAMAKFMAEHGGIGIIHRFLPIEDQAEQVRKVKRSQNILIEDPYFVSLNETVEEAEKIMIKRNVSGLPVLNRDKTLAGIITKRDVLFYRSLHGNGSVAGAMTKNVITAPRNISQTRAKKILCTNSIKKLPLIDRARHLVGLITLKDLLRQEEQTLASKDAKGRLLVGAAIGIRDEDIARAAALLHAGADVLVIDTAHGHNKKVFFMLKQALQLIKKSFPGAEIICGNVATGEAVIDLIEAGADGVKVGIGPGAACETRIVTGVGVPQLSAIDDAVRAAKNSGVPIIADGGIRNSGDLAKAIAMGADTVMLGMLLAGTNESPGEIIMENGVSFKRYRGMASREAAEEKARIDGIFLKTAYREPEGKSGKIQYRGKAINVLEVLFGGLRQSMYYLGAKNIDEFQKNAEFVEISQAGLIESHPHDIKF